MTRSERKRWKFAFFIWQFRRRRCQLFWARVKHWALSVDFLHGVVTIHPNLLLLLSGITTSRNISRRLDKTDSHCFARPQKQAKTNTRLYELRLRVCVTASMARPGGRETHRLHLVDSPQPYQLLYKLLFINVLYLSRWFIYYYILGPLPHKPGEGFF